MADHIPLRDHFELDAQCSALTSPCHICVHRAHGHDDGPCNACVQNPTLNKYASAAAKVAFTKAGTPLGVVKIGSDPGHAGFDLSDMVTTIVAKVLSLPQFQSHEARVEFWANFVSGISGAMVGGLGIERSCNLLRLIADDVLPECEPALAEIKKCHMH